MEGMPLLSDGENLVGEVWGSTSDGEQEEEADPGHLLLSGAQPHLSIQGLRKQPVSIRMRTNQL